MAGDDLEDDFIEDDIVAHSVSDDDEELRPPLDDEDELVPAAEQSDEDNATRTKEEKKRKRRLKEKERKAKKRKLVPFTEEPAGVSVACQSPAVLAQLLATGQKLAHPDMSAMELDDLRYSEENIVDTTSFTSERTLNTLCDFIAQTLPVLKTRIAQKPKQNGAPTVIVVAGAALRVADFTRVFRTMRGEKGGEVAKLFARHFKLEEQSTYLKRTKVGVAVGTPGRLGQLLGKTDALSLKALTHIILDVTFKDAKKRSMLDIPETRDELFRTVLENAAVQEAVQSGKVKVVLF